MTYFPVFLDVRDRRVLVLGGGEVAARKAAPLARAGARVEIAAAFAPALLDGCVLAVGAGAPEADLRALSAAAQERGIPVNVVDRPELCSFIMPALVDRAPLTVAISSGGAAPVLARLVRARIEPLIGPDIGRLAALAERFKAETRRCLPDAARRRRMLEQVFGGVVAERVFAGDEAGAEAAYRQALEAVANAAPAPGAVALVCAEPGAADLLTLRALRLLGAADVIVHDAAVGDAVLDLARRDAARVSAAGTLEEIGALVAELARGGAQVVRLIDGAEPERTAAMATAAKLGWIVVPSLPATMTRGGRDAAGLHHPAKE